MGEPVDPAAVHPHHVAAGDQGVHHRFLGGLDHRFEEGVDVGVRQDFEGGDAAFRVGRLLVGGGEGHEDVAGAVHGDAAEPADGQRGAPDEAVELVGQERRVRGRHDDDGAVAAGPVGVAGVVRVVLVRAFRQEVGDLPAHRGAGDAHLRAAAEVRLHQDAHRVLLPGGLYDPGGSPDAGLEPEGAHPGAAAHRALGDRAAGGVVEGRENMFPAHMEAVDVVEEAVPGLGDQRQAPVRGGEVLLRPGDGGLVDRSHAVGVRDHHRPFEDAPVPEPGGAGHLAVAVQGEPGGEDPAAAPPAPGEDRGDAGAHRALADPERALAADDRAVADLDAGNIGDRVQRPRRAVEGDAEVAGAGRGGLLRGGGAGRNERSEQRERQGGGEGAVSHRDETSSGKRTGRLRRAAPVPLGWGRRGARSQPPKRDGGAPGAAGGRKRSRRIRGGRPSRPKRRAATRNRCARRSAYGPRPRIRSPNSER